MVDKIVAGPLIGRLVVAGFAAGIAIHQAIGANADIDYGLAETAVLFALATVFRLFTLRATVFCGAGSGAHGANVARPGEHAKMTLVIGVMRNRKPHRVHSATSISTVTYNFQQ
jgi:hypothetical protein